MSENPAPASSVLAELRLARAELDRAGNPTPRVDTELLLAWVLGCSRGRLLTAPDLTEAESRMFSSLIARRAAGEPLQHLTGTAPFRHLELAVGPGVFIPRPETELMLELAGPELAAARLVADLGAGSGAIALAVAQEFPAAMVVAVERSDAALGWLRHNVAAAAAADRTAGRAGVQVVQADVGDPDLLRDRAGRFDVVLSNPPYVPTSVRSQLSAEVAADPDEAVFAGPDGLALMPTLIETAARLLRPGGRFVVEHDESHGESVPRLLREAGRWRSVAGHTDLTGRPRFASAIRN